MKMIEFTLSDGRLVTIMREKDIVSFSNVENRLSTDTEILLSNGSRIVVRDTYEDILERFAMNRALLNE